MITFILGIFLSFHGIYPQAAPGTEKICGTVLDQEDGVPLPGAVVHIVETDRYLTTDGEGKFCAEITSGTWNLTFSHLGRRVANRTIDIVPGEIKEIRVGLSYSSFSMEDISVTAQSGGDLQQPGSVSKISKEAIEHLQASSLADIFQLLPGQLSGNPTLSGARQSLLRQVPTTTDAARANALGTGFFVDGIPVSNNANLQNDVTILNSSPGALPPFSSVSGRGTDLREIPPDLVESVEVIQGIPSARYGDITTGAVLVHSRAGRIAPQARFRFNPNMMDANITAGIGDGIHSPGLSFSGNITSSQDDPRQALDQYTRLTGQMNYSQPWFDDNRLQTNVRLQAGRYLDESKEDPDDEVYARTQSSQDDHYQLALRTDYSINENRAHKISLDASISYRRQRAFYAENITRFGLFPLSDAVTDTTIEGTFGTTQYRNKTSVDGNPLNIYSRLEYRNRYEAFGFIHIPMAGLEWKHDSNRGAGRQFDVLLPPRQNYSVGDRPRSFDDIPALNVASVYAEYRLAGYVGFRTVSIQAGIRYDNVVPQSFTKGRFGTVLSPRFNASIELLPNWDLRGGYGITAKVPPLNYLYPGPRYFDIVNFSHFATNPDERRVIITTRVVEPDNSEMKSYESEKVELGTRYKHETIDISLTWFHENTDGAYGFTRNIFPIEFERFEAVEYPEGRPPVLDEEPVETRTFLGAYDRPLNSRTILNEGTELNLLWQIDNPFLSSLSLTGAYIKTKSGDEAVDIDTDQIFRADIPDRIGIFNREGFESERLTTSLRFIHHFPELGMVVSWMAQTVWMDRDQRVNTDLNPTGYITSDGERVEIPSVERTSQKYDDIRRQVSDSYLIIEKRPPLWLFNLRMSKSFTSGVEASFFANNIFASQPLYESRRRGGFVRRNPPLFFGFDLTVRLTGLGLW